jgi:TP901 family phage tail tape measure protein
VALRTVGVRMMADVSNYVANMGRAEKSTKSFSEGLGQKAAAGKLDAIADRAGIVGLGVAAGFGMAVKAAMDFDKQMSAVKAATHASAAEMESLRKAAIKAGADSQYSATEAAQGIEELAKAGVSTADILGGGLKGALDLAAAGQIDVAAAAETAASALTQFKLKGQDVPHVADLLAAAAGKAQGSVGDMSAALNQAGLIAAQTGLSIEDTTGTLAAFANAGLIGSDAGTSFKTMLQAVQAPSGKTKELMDDLGISAYDTAGNFIGITKFAGQLKEQLGKLTPELRANALAQIFGSDATRAASILYEQGSTGITNWIAKTNDAGYAAETAAIKTDNLAGDLERLKGSVDTLLIQSGGGANTGLRAITKTLESMVDQFGRLPPGVTATITVLGLLTAAVLLGGAAWVKVRSAIASTVAELNAVGPAGAKAATGLQAATKWAGYAAAAFVGLEVAGAVFDKLGNSAVNVNKLTAALQDYATTGKMTEGVTQEFGTGLEDLSLIAQSAEAATHGFWGELNNLVSGVPGVRSVVDSMNESLTGTSFNDATDRMKALDESFTAFIATQKDAKKAGELWNEILLKSNLDTQQLQALLPNTSAAMTKLQEASHGGATAQDRLATSATKTKEELEKEAEAAKTLQKAFDELFDRYMSSDQAAIEYEKTLASTNKTLKEGSKDLRTNTEAGQENRSAVLALIKAIKDQREANINNGMSVDKADALYRKQIGTLKKNLIQTDFQSKAVGRLVNKYDEIPGKVGTKVEITGDKQVLSRLANLKAYQDALKRGSSVVSIRKQLSKDNADFLKFDTGGRTPSVGIHEPAGIVQGQEFVLDAKTVKNVDRQNPGFLDELHATHSLPGYAGGGRVAWPFPTTAAGTKIPSAAEVASKVVTAFSRDWPSSPSAQRGDSGIWRKVVSMIKATGPLSGSFGNGYRPGDPKWHGSGRAVDWMGFNQDALATYLTRQRPLELIHRTGNRDYAYTRGVNKGSFNNALMQAHRNHIHIAMAGGGVIREPVVGVGASGRSYSFGERGAETVTPGTGAWNAGGGGAATIVNHYDVKVDVAPGTHPAEVGRQFVVAVQAYERGSGKSWRS